MRRRQARSNRSPSHLCGRGPPQCAYPPATCDTTRIQFPHLGAGGPDPEEGRPPGTVFIAVCGPGERLWVDRCQVAGGPGEVVEAATMQVLHNLSVAAEQG